MSRNRSTGGGHEAAGRPTPDPSDEAAAGAGRDADVRTFERREEPFEDLLDLLDDRYVRTILEALSDGPRPARELTEDCGASRATVYRRLDRLEDHGLVAAGVEVHADGHHRKTFAARFERLTVGLEGGRLRLSLATGDGAAAEHPVDEGPAGEDSAGSGAREPRGRPADAD